MQLKEVLNIRRLREGFYDAGLGCERCPFVSVCPSVGSEHGCIVRNIFENVPFSDLYEMERNGDLSVDYQVEPADCSMKY